MFTIHVACHGDQFVGSQQHEWTHLFARCQWSWMMVGTKSNSTFQILQGGHMGPIMLKPCACKCMPIVEFAGSISQTGSMLRMNCLGSLNFSYHFRYVPEPKGKIFITKLVAENDTLVEKFVTCSIHISMIIIQPMCICMMVYVQKSWIGLAWIASSCCFVNTIFASMQLADHQHYQPFGWSLI
jgi:hypothetical protein